MVRPNFKLLKKIISTKQLKKVSEWETAWNIIPK